MRRRRRHSNGSCAFPAHFGARALPMRSRALRSRSGATIGSRPTGAALVSLPPTTILRQRYVAGLAVTALGAAGQ